MTPMIDNLDPIWTPQHGLPALQEAVAKLSRRAEKLGTGAITLRVTDEEEREVLRRDNGRSFEPKRFQVYSKLEIEGTEPKLNGWRVVATIAHEQAESGDTVAMIRKSPFFEGDIAADAFSTDARCDHCQTSRRRNDTYVVEHDDGRQAQVGSNCLKDFTGHGSPEAVIRYLNLLYAARALAEQGDADPDEPGYEGGRQAMSWHLVDFLTHTQAAIRVGGFLSRSKAYEQYGFRGMGTADDVLGYLLGSAKDRRESKIEIKDADLTVAEAVIDWLETLSPTIEEDYLWNLAAIRDVGLVNYRTAGYVASMISAMNRDLDRKAEAADLAGSEYVGDPKSRLDFEGTMIFETSFEGYYGPTFLYKFLTTNGDVLVWFASSHQGLDRDTLYSFKATVKKHETRDGIKQTTINRAASFAALEA